MRYIATNANFAIIANAMLIKIGLVINCILIRSVFRALTMSSQCTLPVARTTTEQSICSFVSHTFAWQHTTCLDTH